LSEEFYRIAARLKSLPRKGWLRAGVERPETVAAHSYLVALLAMVTADLHGLDALKVVRMALLHDLGEALIGDITPKDESWPIKTTIEQEAVERILGHLPQEVQDRYLELWRELQEGGSPEARLVQEVDKAEMALQALLYREAGYPATRLEEFLESGIRGVRDPLLKRLLEEASTPRR
jgi:putative hydrolase of HD superfamily